jgi:hypothetical protein
MYEEFREDGAVVWMQNQQLVNAWLEDGRQAVPIKPHEVRMSPHDFISIITAERDAGKYRCTGCSELHDGPPAGRPLFAGITCAACWEQHKQYLAQQRREGKVCGRCGSPLGACCC